MAEYGAGSSPEHVARIRMIADRQRVITVLFLIMLVANLLGAVNVAFLVIGMLMGVVLIVQVVKMMQALEARIGMIILACIGLLVPVVSLLTVFIVNQQACSVLRRAGLRVGFLGVSREEIARLGARDGVLTGLGPPLSH